MGSNNFEQGLAKVLRESLGLKRIEKEAIKDVVKYLDSQGMVRKVDGKVPEFQSRLTERANMERIVKEGWSKTERLI